MKLSKDLKDRCQASAALKPYWDFVAGATCDLIIARSYKLVESIRFHQTRVETATALELALLRFEETQKILFRELGKAGIAHPASLDPLKVFELYI